MQSLLCSLVFASLSLKWTLEQSLCTRLKTTGDIDLEGVSLTREHLYLTERGVVQRIPLNGHFFATSQIALFDRQGAGASGQFGLIGKWSDIEWIRKHLRTHKIDAKKTALKSMVIYGLDERMKVKLILEKVARISKRHAEESPGQDGDDDGEQQTPDVPSGQDEQPSAMTELSSEGFIVMSISNGVSSVQSVESSEPNHEIADHLRQLTYNFCSSENGVAICSEQRQVHLSLSTDQKLIYFSVGKPAGEPMITDLPVFGFILFAGNRVHLWDVTARRVFLFQLTTHFSRPIPVQVVPFESYFVCKESDWAKPKVVAATTAPTTVPTRTKANSPLRTTQLNGTTKKSRRKTPLPDDALATKITSLVLVVIFLVIVATCAVIICFWCWSRNDSRDVSVQETTAKLIETNSRVKKSQMDSTTSTITSRESSHRSRKSKSRSRSKSHQSHRSKKRKKSHRRQ